ncbi:unnamed protein product (macronuclear) [Paramecium tetraurelia]|uniref:RING-type domain-containing protein n=1 Tax=Paramecium tetraurelia TaxID=5888 RepID=A0BC47_PARTE|nr:uncharacterized protein GSPATT00000550001 [Paramecium tetraurelia]CAK56114.1 unnamed protein product [Paramecium tetraurelia]|eukprot:XP_001423512.1 hypothetical protein (macronuclear) [Paramecium tetraurelia strain d4-2]
MFQYIKKCYAYFQKKCIQYQNNPSLKKHTAYNCILLVLTIIIRTFFEIYLRQQLAIESDQLPLEHNKEEINDPIFEKHYDHIQLSYRILDHSLHLILSLEILTLILQITLIINKGKQELPLLNPLLEQEKNECSVQFVQSSNYGFSSLQNNQQTFNSIEMQLVSRNKGTSNQIKNSSEEKSPLNFGKQFQQNKNITTQREEFHQIQEEPHDQSPKQIANSQQNIVTENPIYETTSNIQNESDQISIQISYPSRVQKYKNGKLKTVYIIQKCKKQVNCNFFWISSTKRSNYFCLNCDQKNIIDQNKKHVEIEKTKQDINVETNKIFLSNQFEQQLFEITKIYKNNTFQFCYNFEFCGFFWMNNRQFQSNQYYCPTCQEYYTTKDEETQGTIYKELTCKCSYCHTEAQEHFQSPCLHAYHYECLKELGKNYHQANIPCIACNVNMLSSLKKNNILSKETFENIFDHQIKVMREESMHEE